MLERIGMICSRTGDRLAIVSSIGAIAALNFADDTPIDDGSLVGNLGIVAFLIGRTIQYVLVSPTQLNTQQAGPTEAQCLEFTSL